MAKEHKKELLPFLKPFDPAIIELVLWLREFAWDLHPEANELIYDNYNAVAFGWSPTEKQGHTFCSIAIGRSSKNVHFGFYRGNELSDPDKILLGEGNQYRYILVTDKTKFPKDYISRLVAEAHAKSIARVKNPKDIMQGKTLVKSISEKKRPEKKQGKAK